MFFFLISSSTIQSRIIIKSSVARIIRICNRLIFHILNPSVRWIATVLIWFSCASSSSFISLYAHNKLAKKEKRWKVFLHTQIHTEWNQHFTWRSKRPIKWEITAHTHKHKTTLSFHCHHQKFHKLKALNFIFYSPSLHLYCHVIHYHARKTTTIPTELCEGGHTRTHAWIVEAAIQIKMMSENDGRDDDELLCSICVPHNEQSIEKWEFGRYRNLARRTEYT